MSNLEASYNFILNKLIEISGTENFYFKPVKPKISDIELISLIILAEFKSIDSEYQLFREIKGWAIESKIERSVYNRRKRKLFPFLEEIRCKMVKKFNDFENYFLVDSMPLEVCKLSRSSRSKICKENSFSMPQIKVFVLLKIYTFMVTSYMRSVLLLVCSKVLTYLPPPFTTFII